MELSLRLAGDVEAAPSDGPDACLCAAIRMLARLVTNRFDRVLASCETTPTEFQLMVKLHSAPASAIELSHRLRIDPAPVGRSLLRMQERGLVVRASRRRFARWSLTDEGRIRLEVLDPTWSEVNASIRRDLGRELATRIVRYVDNERSPRRREHRGWTDD
jgi:DNA-binding MarR family transcriptional regulator